MYLVHGFIAGLNRDIQIPLEQLSLLYDKYNARKSLEAFELNYHITDTLLLKTS